MTSKGDFYAPPNEQQYQQGGVAYKEQQDYEILEAGLVPNTNAGGRSGAAELEKQLRLGEQYSSSSKRSLRIYKRIANTRRRVERFKFSRTGSQNLRFSRLHTTTTSAAVSVCV